MGHSLGADQNKFPAVVKDGLSDIESDFLREINNLKSELELQRSLMR